MKYFKNSELVDLYNISDKSVRNWIEAASEGRLAIELYAYNNKKYVADTIQNCLVIEGLVRKGRKYRNTRSHRVIVPKADFYQLYDKNQVFDIVNNLDTYHELPWGYMYFGEGASYWNKYLDKLKKAGSGNILTNTAEMIDENISYLDGITKRYKQVNIVNLCVGNSLSLENLIRHFNRIAKLNRIITIDMSREMLQYSAANLSNWIEDPAKLETHIRDVTHQRFNDILLNSTDGQDTSEVVNIILLVAGPIANFREPEQVLRVIRDSMNKGDILITSQKQDNQNSRTFFDFSLQSEEKGLLNTQDKLILNALNIQDSFYEPEQVFDPVTKVRCVQVRLKLDLSISFDLDNFHKTVELKKGERILLWRAHHNTLYSCLQLYSDIGFDTLQLSKSFDNQLIFTISRIKTSTQVLNR